MSLPSSLKTPTSVFEPDKFRFAQSVFLDDSTFQHPPFLSNFETTLFLLPFLQRVHKNRRAEPIHAPAKLSIAASATFPISSHAIATTINSIDHTNQTCFSSPFGLLPTQPLDKAIDPDPGTFQASRQSTPLTTSPNSNMPPRTAANFHYAPPQLLIPALTWVPSSNTQTYIPLATDLRRRLRSLLQATAHRVCPLTITPQHLRQHFRFQPSSTAERYQSGTRQDSTQLGRLRRHLPRASSALPASPASQALAKTQPTWAVFDDVRHAPPARFQLHLLTALYATQAHLRLDNI